MNLTAASRRSAVAGYRKRCTGCSTTRVEQRTSRRSGVRTDSSLGAFSMCLLGVVLALLVFLPPLGQFMGAVRGSVLLPDIAEPTYLVGETPDLHIIIALGLTRLPDYTANWRTYFGPKLEIAPSAWWVGKARCSREEALRRIASEHPSGSRRAFVSADARLPFGEVAAAMQALGSAGFERVFLMTRGPHEVLVLDLLDAQKSGHTVAARAGLGSFSSIRPHNFALQPSGAPGSD